MTPSFLQMTHPNSDARSAPVLKSLTFCSKKQVNVNKLAEWIV